MPKVTTALRLTRLCSTIGRFQTSLNRVTRLANRHQPLLRAVRNQHGDIRALNAKAVGNVGICVSTILETELPARYMPCSSQRSKRKQPVRRSAKPRHRIQLHLHTSVQHKSCRTPSADNCQNKSQLKRNMAADHGLCVGQRHRTDRVVFKIDRAESVLGRLNQIPGECLTQILPQTLCLLDIVGAEG